MREYIGMLTGEEREALDELTSKGRTQITKDNRSADSAWVQSYFF
jgi:hypothetical protein